MVGENIIQEHGTAGSWQGKAKSSYAARRVRGRGKQSPVKRHGGFVAGKQSPVTRPPRPYMTGAVLSCRKSNAFVMLEQCFGVAKAMFPFSKLT